MIQHQTGFRKPCSVSCCIDDHQIYDMNCSDSKFEHLLMDNAEDVLANLTIYSAGSDKALYRGWEAIIMSTSEEIIVSEIIFT